MTYSQIVKNVWGFNEYGQPDVYVLYDGLPIEMILCKQNYSPNLKFFKYIAHGSYQSFYYYKSHKINDLNKLSLLKDSGRCNYGIRIGIWIEYYPPKFIHNEIFRGKIKESGTYFYGHKVGTWKYYDLIGKEKAKFHDLNLKALDIETPYITKYLENDSIIVKYNLIKGSDGYTFEDYSIVKGVGYGYDEYCLLMSAQRISWLSTMDSIQINDTIKIKVADNIVPQGTTLRVCKIDFQSSYQKNLLKKARENKN